MAIFQGMRRKLGALSVCFLLSACGGGGGGGGGGSAGISSPQLPNAYRISMASGSAAPFAQVEATVSTPDGSPVDLSTMELVADYGDGVSAPLSFDAVAANTISFRVPVGVIISSDVPLGAGAVRLSIHSTAPSPVLESSGQMSLNIDPGRIPALAPGEISRRHLTAVRNMLLDAVAKLTLISSRMDAADAAAAAELIRGYNAEISNVEAMIEEIARAQSGEVVTSTGFNGESTTLDAATLKSLDYSLYVTYLMPSASSAASSPAGHIIDSLMSVVSGSSGSTDSDAVDVSLQDFQDLPNQHSDNVKEVTDRQSGFLGGILKFVPAAKLQNAVNKLVAFSVSTSVALAADGGASKVAKGKAAFEEFKTATREKITGFTQAAKDFLADKVSETATRLKETLGIQDKQAAFEDTEVQDAFQSGDLPQNGLPDSAFTVDVTTQLTPEGGRTIDVKTSTTTTGANIRVQVTSADSSQTYDVATVNGQASISAPVGDYAKRYSITAVDLGGNSVDSISVTAPEDCISAQERALDPGFVCSTPQAHDIIYETDVDTATTQSLAAFNADSHTIKQGPSHGSVELVDPVNGIFRYQPNAGFTGQDTFTYIAVNEFGSSVEVTVTVNVKFAFTNCSESIAPNSSGGKTYAYNCSGLKETLQTDASGVTYYSREEMSNPEYRTNLLQNKRGSLELNISGGAVSRYQVWVESMAYVKTSTFFGDIKYLGQEIIDLQNGSAKTHSMQVNTWNPDYSQGSGSKTRIDCQYNTYRTTTGPVNVNGFMSGGIGTVQVDLTFDASKCPTPDKVASLAASAMQKSGVDMAYVSGTKVYQMYLGSPP